MPHGWNLMRLRLKTALSTTFLAASSLTAAGQDNGPKYPTCVVEGLRHGAVTEYAAVATVVEMCLRQEEALVPDYLTSIIGADATAKLVTTPSGVALRLKFTNISGWLITGVSVLITTAKQTETHTAIWFPEAVNGGVVGPRPNVIIDRTIAPSETREFDIPLTASFAPAEYQWSLLAFSGIKLSQ